MTEQTCRTSLDDADDFSGEAVQIAHIRAISLFVMTGLSCTRSASPSPVELLADVITYLFLACYPVARARKVGRLPFGMPIADCRLHPRARMDLRPPRVHLVFRGYLVYVTGFLGNIVPAASCGFNNGGQLRRVWASCTGKWVRPSVG